MVRALWWYWYALQDADDHDGKGDPSASADSVVRRSHAEFLRNVKNTYRVLLSRGMRGCYVYFQDKATENFFRSRIELFEGVSRA